MTVKSMRQAGRLGKVSGAGAKARRAEMPNSCMMREITVTTPAYIEIIEIIDFIAAGTTPDAVVHFRPSAEEQRRVDELVEREKGARLSSDEKAELDHFMELEHILRMAKVRAHDILSSGQ
jgi:hypothetical protein